MSDYSDIDSDYEEETMVAPVAAPVGSSVPAAAVASDVKLDKGEPVRARTVNESHFENYFTVDVDLSNIAALQEMRTNDPTCEATHFDVSQDVRDKYLEHVEHGGYTKEQADMLKKAESIVLVGATITRKMNCHDKKLVLHNDKLVGNLAGGGLDVAWPGEYAAKLDVDIFKPVGGGMNEKQYRLLKNMSKEQIGECVLIHKSAKNPNVSWGRIVAGTPLHAMLKDNYHALPEHIQSQIDLKPNKKGYIDVPVELAESIKHEAESAVKDAMARTLKFDDLQFYITGEKRQDLTVATKVVNQTMGESIDQMSSQPYKTTRVYGWMVSLKFKPVLA